jgi:hypothetical protein
VHPQERDLPLLSRHPTTFLNVPHSHLHAYFRSPFRVLGSLPVTSHFPNLRPTMSDVLIFGHYHIMGPKGLGMKGL